MGEIIPFPNFSQRSWNEIEGALREMLASNGLANEAIDWICEDLKPRYDAIHTALSLSIEVPKQCLESLVKLGDELTKFVHDVTSKALLQMVLLEINLHFAQHRAGDSGSK